MRLTLIHPRVQPGVYINGNYGIYVERFKPWAWYGKIVKRKDGYRYLQYREGKEVRQIYIGKEDKKVKNYCPRCNAPVKESDMKCPTCGYCLACESD